MTNISQVLGSRKGRILSVAPGESVNAAIQSMAKHEVGALLVMDKGKLVGILSERDYARKIILEGKSADSTKVNEIMVAKVICAKLDMTKKEAMAIMAKNNIRHLPVVDEKKEVVGVVSIRDFVHDLEGEDEE